MLDLCLQLLQLLQSQAVAQLQEGNTRIDAKASKHTRTVTDTWGTVAVVTAVQAASVFTKNS